MDIEKKCKEMGIRFVPCTHIRNTRVLKRIKFRKKYKWLFRTKDFFVLNYLTLKDYVISKLITINLFAITISALLMAYSIYILINNPEYSNKLTYILNLAAMTAYLSNLILSYRYRKL